MLPKEKKNLGYFWSVLDINLCLRILVQLNVTELHAFCVWSWTNENKSQFFFFNLFQVNSIHVTLEMMSYLVVLDINLCLSTQYLWNFIGNLLIISYCFILSGMCLLCVSVPTASCSALFLMNKWYILLGFHICRSTKAWQFFFLATARDQSWQLWFMKRGFGTLLQEDFNF